MVEVIPRPTDVFDAWQMIYKTVRIELTRALRGIDLSVEEHEVLLALLPAVDATVSARDLAIALRRETSNCVRLVMRMEERGLLIRLPNPDQSNERLVRLTTTGLELGRQARQVHADALETSFHRHVSVEDEATVTRLLQAVVPPVDHTELIYPNDRRYRSV